MIYAGLGEKDQALTWLEKAYEQLFNPSILVRPAFDPLRSDRRFQDLLCRIGLPSRTLRVEPMWSRFAGRALPLATAKRRVQVNFDSRGSRR